MTDYNAIADAAYGDMMDREDPQWQRGYREGYEDALADAKAAVERIDVHPYEEYVTALDVRRSAAEAIDALPRLHFGTTPRTKTYVDNNGIVQYIEDR